MFQHGCQKTCGNGKCSAKLPGSGCPAGSLRHDSTPRQGFWKHSGVGAAPSDRRRAQALEAGAALGHRCALLPRVCLSHGRLHLLDNESAVLAAKTLEGVSHPYNAGGCPIRGDDAFRVSPLAYQSHGANSSRALALAWLPTDVRNYGEHFVNSVVPVHELSQRLRGETFALRPMLLGGASAAKDLLQAMAEEPVATWSAPSPECFERLAVCRLRDTSRGGTYPGKMQPWAAAQAIGRTLLGAARWEAARTTTPHRRVVYVQRKRRAIVNLPSLVGWCTGGVLRGVACTQWEFGRGLAADLSVVRQAGVMVGMHGAGLANAFFMPRGSSVVEIRPYGFEGPWPDKYVKLQTSLEDALLYFQLSMGSPSLCGKQPDAFLTTVYDARDGACRVPRAGLSRVFRAVKWMANVTGERRKRARSTLPWTASIFTVYDDDELHERVASDHSSSRVSEALLARTLPPSFSVHTRLIAAP